MTKSLYTLLKASGYPNPSAGQSFRNHVAPQSGGLPGTGNKMSDYNIYSWSWDDAGAPAPLAEQTGYATGTVFSMTFHFSEAALASYIRRTDQAAMTMSFGAGGSFGSSMSVSTSISQASTTGTADLTMTSRINPNAKIDQVAGVMYVGSTAYPDPLLAPDGPNNITWTAATQTGAGSGQETELVHFSYNPDLGGFNGVLAKEYYIKMNDRAAANSDFVVDWSSTGTESASTAGNLGLGLSATVAQVHQGEQTDVYYRFKFSGQSSWDGGNSGGWRLNSYQDTRAYV